ncbi:MAG: Fic family protein [Planctomycetota bacterium]|nr:Fic family protein [Planctomycetota bacterium]MDA1211391.1 Fic family protein [Planctomycetota bacterium]
MDQDRFRENATGNIVRTTTLLGEDWAFVPNFLPPTWEFKTDLWPLLHNAGNRLSTLNGIGQTLPEPELLLRPLQSREAITSSNMEGTYVTPEQLLIFEMDPREPKSADDKKSDWLEVFNYSRALASGFEAINSGMPIGGPMIRQIHSVLMRGVRGSGKSPGQFRQKQVQIGSNARFVPPPPSEVPHLMDNLTNYIETDDNAPDPLIKAFIAHYQFEAIHPFEDGNGRVGRVLLSLMIYKWSGHAKPWLYLSPYFELFKDEYTGYLFQVSTDGRWDQWIKLCLTGVAVQSDDSIRRCHMFNECRDKYHKKVGSPTARTHSIIEGLFCEPVVSITSIQRKYGVTYHTAKADLERIQEAGIITELANIRPRAFFARDLMAIAYTSDVNQIVLEG